MDAFSGFHGLSRCHNTTELCGLALREVLQDEAKVSQAVFERAQGQDSGLIGRVQLEDRQHPPAPGRTVGRGLEGSKPLVRKGNVFIGETRQNFSLLGEITNH